MTRDVSTWGTTVVEGPVDGHPCRLFSPRRSSVAELLEDGRRWADRDFLVQGERRITFADVLAAVEFAGARLTERGMRPGDRVMVLAANSPDWVVSFLAIVANGAVAVLGNGWWPEEDVAYAVDLTMAGLVIADARRAERVPSASDVVEISDLTAGTRSPVERRPVEIAEDDAAYVIFTSGTTARPKAALLSHRSAVANLHNLLAVARSLPHQLRDDSPQPVTLCAFPLFHISGVQTILQHLVTGGRMVFLPGRFDAGQVLTIIESERVTHWAAVPSMAALVVDHPDIARRDLSSLQAMFLGGAPVAPELIQRVRMAIPVVRHSVAKGYGSTEAGGTVTMGGGRSLEERPTRSGKPMPLVEVRILQPDGEGVGEILVRSPAVMTRYLGVPADEQPVDANGWLYTGDLGRLDDGGFLHVTGRKKDVIIRGGENVAAPSVEACLLGHPAVGEVAVVGLEHPVWGEEVAAAVRVRWGQTVTAADLQGFAAARLAHFAVPTRWWLRSEPFPMTDSGKIRKADLKADWPAAV